jgi:hypothetical protein
MQLLLEEIFLRIFVGGREGAQAREGSRLADLGAAWDDSLFFHFGFATSSSSTLFLHLSA